MVRWVHVPYRRDLPHRLDDAFAWLTDYDEGDADRAGAIITRRRPVEAGPDRVVLEGRLDTLGRSYEGRAVVELHPPDRWVADMFDEKDRKWGHNEYRLEPRADEGGCTLTVDYRFVAPKLRHLVQLTLAKPLIRREVDRMWDGFVEAMAEDLGPA